MAGFSGLFAPSHAAELVDLELVLAVDTSRSMDFDELLFQREGYAQALEHPAVTSAFSMGQVGRIAITYFEWGGQGNIRVLVDWTVLESPEDAVNIAKIIRAVPILGLRGTSISGAMEFAAQGINSNDFIGARRVIDISGDGPNNRGRPVTIVRDEVAAMGIEINGLPFMIKKPGGLYSIEDLDFYYENCVVTGESAFVIPIFRMDRLVASIRQKLVLEIAGHAPMPKARIHNAAGVDCMIGEKLLQQRRWDFP